MRQMRTHLGVHRLNAFKQDHIVFARDITEYTASAAVVKIKQRQIARFLGDELVKTLRQRFQVECRDGIVIDPSRRQDRQVCTIFEEIIKGDCKYLSACTLKCIGQKMCRRCFAGTRRTGDGDDLQMMNGKLGFCRISNLIGVLLLAGKNVLSEGLFHGSLLSLVV